MWEKFSCSKLGCYEKRFLFLLTLVTVPTAFSPLSSLILHYTPSFHCALKDNYQDNKTTEHDRNLSESDDQVNSCIYQNISGNISYHDESEVSFCSKIIFSGPEISAATEFELVCDRSWMKPILILIYFIGIMVGSLIGGFLSDRFGRKPILLIFAALQCIVTIAMSFVGDVPSYAVMLFLSGATSLVTYMAAFVLGVEIVTPKYRSLIYLLTNTGFSCGYMILPLFAYYLRDWRWFLRATALVGVVYIPMYWLLDESPYWLTSVGNSKKAKNIREKIMKFNGEQNQPKLETVEKKEEEVQGCFKSLGTIFREPVLIGRLLILTLAWTILSMSYYNIALNTNDLSGNRFLNMFYGGLTSWAGTVIFLMIVDVLGRRNTYSGIMSIAAVSFALVPLLAIWSQTAVTVTTMIAKLLVSVAYGVVYVYSGELFPTTTRQSIIATLSSAGRIGSMVSPFVMYSGVSGSKLTPSFITAGLIALSAATVMLLPETRNKVLPQTIQQAVAMKRNFTFPCSRKSRNAAETEMQKL